MNHPIAVDGPEFSLNPELADALRDLWTDDMIPVLLDSPSRFSLSDDAAYFFSEARRITARDYIPSNEDILRVPVRTDVGITETYLEMGELSLRLCHIPRQLGQRKKWIHYFEGVTGIIFCAPLTDYACLQGSLRPDVQDRKLQDRLGESLTFFESVINSRCFPHTSIIIFLTGIDEVKPPKVPLDKYFPEYTGGADVDKAAKYILWRFMQANRARLNVIKQATDTSIIQLAFGAVQMTILQRALGIR